MTKLSPAQVRLLDRVKAANDKGTTYGVQTRQFASAEVLLREGLVVDVTKPSDFTQHLLIVEV